VETKRTIKLVIIVALIALVTSSRTNGSAVRTESKNANSIPNADEFKTYASVSRVVPDSPGYVTVSGYLSYENNASEQKPIRFATVDLYDRTWYTVDTLLATTHTNAQGFYQFPPVENVDELGGQGTLDLYIFIVCDSEAVKVVPTLPVNIWPYRWHSEIEWDVPDGSLTIDGVVLNGTNNGSWGIYESILNAYMQTEAEVGYEIPKITVVWPWPWTHFGQIWVLQYIGIEGGYEWDPDVVDHEYGHWVMSCLYDGNLPPVDYGSDEVHYWDSHETPETAWVEGLADFYPCAIQGDRYFFGYDLEDQWPKGDDVEGAVACLLWDIFDSSDDGRDTVSTGIGEIWSVLQQDTTEGHNVFDIHEFWNELLAHFCPDSFSKQQLWGIFYDHGINKDSTCPSNPNVWTSSHPLREWNSDNTIDAGWSNASDDLSGIRGYSIEWDTDQSALPDATEDLDTSSCTSTPLSSGSNWYLHIRTVDNAGNWNPDAFHIGPFYINTSGPSEPSLSESQCGSNWSTHNSPYFEWTDSGITGSNASYYEGCEDDGTPFIVSSPYHPTWADGVHIFKVRAVDAADIRSGWSNLITVKIDTTPPTLAILSPYEGQTVDSSNVIISWSGSDGTGSGINHYEVKLDMGGWIDVGPLTQHMLSGIYDGNHTITVKAVDEAENQQESSGNFIVNTARLIDHEIIVDDQTFYIVTESNSTISNLRFDKDQKGITLDVEGLAETTGFCNIIIPADLLGSPYTVRIDNSTILQDYSPPSNQTHFFLYFSYNHSAHRVEIIGTTAVPEFQLVSIFLVLHVSTMLILALRKKPIENHEKKRGCA